MKNREIAIAFISGALNDPLTIQREDAFYDDSKKAGRHEATIPTRWAKEALSAIQDLPGLADFIRRFLPQIIDSKRVFIVADPAFIQPLASGKAAEQIALDLAKELEAKALVFRLLPESAQGLRDSFFDALSS